MNTGLARQDLYKIENICAQEVAKKVRFLIEEKHLYQSIDLPKKDLMLTIQENLDAGAANEWSQDLSGIVDNLLITHWKTFFSTSLTDVISPKANPLDTVDFCVKHIKTLCGNCGESSPMNINSADNINLNSRERSHSVYVFSFQCQNCLTGVEVFAVARKSAKLTLAGRWPMEQVCVPKFLPRDYQKYYSGAIIAFNSGQVLPALFMLRTFIEQYTRAVTPDSLKLADEVLDAYMTQLPDDFKRRFPSLRDIYGELSDAVHEAREDAELFNKSRGKIENHFEAKKIFDLAASLTTKEQS